MPADDPRAETHKRPLAEVLDRLEVDPAQGLSAADAKQRLTRHGPNELRRIAPASAWRLLVAQFASLVMALLVAAAALSFVFGDVIEGLAVVALIVLNVTIGFTMELRAARAMEALRQMGGPVAHVRRDKTVKEVAAQHLVPGDVVILDAGDLIAADVRLTSASRLRADESTFTGESAPVGKTVDETGSDVPLHDRTGMVFKGTRLVMGSGEGVVVATGTHTELGHIASLVETARSETTPLERRLARLGRRLILVTLLLVVVIAALGIVRGKPIVLMVETSIALAVAAIPEGLPVVATLALARGMLRMSKRNALVRRLSAVETLGSTNVICVDKTGTLTENRMTVQRVAVPGDDPEAAADLPFGAIDQADDAAREAVARALRAGVLCNNASLELGEARGTGDPMEVALLRAGHACDMHRPTLVDEWAEVREEAFDPETKRMATVHRREDGHRVFVKGAPEAVLQVSDRVRGPGGIRPLQPDERARWQALNERMANAGLRVLAVAEKDVPGATSPADRELVWLGLIGLMDPPRADVPDAVRACRDAGVRVVMMTGDQAGTARRIAYDVGMTETPDAPVVSGHEIQEGHVLTETPIFARVDPAQKLAIIAAHQAAGSVVAMTGDGVNDAPALRKADIGVAMGQRGTEVAREAADIVLRDDAFPSIVSAIREGRIVFTNIRRFAFYLLSCNVGEVAIIGAAALINAPLPLLPLQILFLNLVTDVFPALALGFGRGDEGQMRQPPRPRDESFLTRGHWAGIAAYGALFMLSVLGAFFLSFRMLGLGYGGAVSVAFITLAFGQLWHVFNMRERGSHVWRNDVVQNRYVWGAIVLSGIAVLVAVLLPPLGRVLGLANPGTDGWLLAIGASLVPVVVGQVVKALRGPRPGSFA